MKLSAFIRLFHGQMRPADYAVYPRADETVSFHMMGNLRAEMRDLKSAHRVQGYRWSSRGVGRGASIIVLIASMNSGRTSLVA